MRTIFEENMKEFLEGTLDPLQKEEEWFHPHARILVLQQETEGAGGQMKNKSQFVQRDFLNVVAYGVFRFDTEENADDDLEDEVLYCYELQVSSTARRQGLGRELLELMSLFGKQHHMKKVMLTCFKANEDAIAFYKKIGFTNDPICPSQWADSESEEETEEEEEEEEIDYFILSKPLNT
ncbi:hypothetical protein FRC15_006105 [Serendipita sp. 397]|nr:hypothetical protein FRC15_006105 [Serendipita sp. 397]